MSGRRAVFQQASSTCNLPSRVCACRAKCQNQRCPIHWLLSSPNSFSSSRCWRGSDSSSKIDPRQLQVFDQYFDFLNLARADKGGRMENARETLDGLTDDISPAVSAERANSSGFLLPASNGRGISTLLPTKNARSREGRVTNNFRNNCLRFSFERAVSEPEPL
ncbi:MAG: hypothetical protein H6669_15270 [Ardenticatenaceae bacterium]|nr:hypothetical protein [Ardenticatenaceae bacterium]